MTNAKMPKKIPIKNEKCQELGIMGCYFPMPGWTLLSVLNVNDVPKGRGFWFL